MNKVKDLHIKINEECRFCIPAEKERILYESENFYVMVSLGPIVEGYLLIVTKSHIGSFLNLPNKYLNEFLEVKNLVSRILIKQYGACLFYEHGKIGSSLKFNNSNRHCYHAHMHCVPVELKMNDVVNKEFNYNKYSSFESAYKTSDKVQKYLYIEDDSSNVYIPTEDIRKQYLRWVLSESLNKEGKWNWVENQSWGIIYKTIEQLKPYFNE